MKQLRTLDEAVQTFLTYSPVDMKGSFSLPRTKEMMHLLGDPQEQLKVIHIAGTSGKTSTAYFIRGLLEASGCRTGLTVSPHIATIAERIQLDGQPIDTERFLAYTNDLLLFLDANKVTPSYFGIIIALAYRVFAMEKVDYAVIETGLGGLLDSTNVVTRKDKVCVITDIGLDHTEILGDTIAEIAAQKAGIIQPHNHVIMNRQTPEVMAIMQRTAHEQQATLEIVDNTTAPESLPAYQRRNWALAMAVFQYLRSRDSLPDLGDRQHAVVSQTPPGRWEVYRCGDKTIILDGAHNPQKLTALLDSLKAQGIDSAAILANFVTAPEAKIKDILRILRPFSGCLIIPEFSVGQDLKSRRSMPSNTLADYAEEAGFVRIIQQPDPHEAFQELLQQPEKTLIVTGSLYLVGNLRPYVIEHCRLVL